MGYSPWGHKELDTTQRPTLNVDSGPRHRAAGLSEYRVAGGVVLVQRKWGLGKVTALLVMVSVNETTCMHAKSLQSCPTLCDPMDCSLTGSSVHGILQARILEWVAMPFSQGLGIFPTQGLNLHLFCLLRWEVGSLPLAPPGHETIIHIE